MYRSGFLLLLFALGTSSPVVAVPCSGFLADINSSGGCTIGDKLFSAFTVQTINTAGNAVLTINNVVVSSPPGEVYSLTFSTVGGFSALSGVLDFVVHYTVATTSGLALIEGLSLSVGDVNMVNLLSVPTATVSAQEFACLGVGVSVVGTPGSYQCSDQNAGMVLNATPSNPGQVTFTPTAAVSVAKRLNVQAGLGTLATISSITNEVSQIPEPSTYVTLGFGLLTLAARARLSRRRTL